MPGIVSARTGDPARRRNFKLPFIPFSGSARPRAYAARSPQAFCMPCSYNADMTALTIRDVPDDALVTLKARAAKAGKSLQAYALDVLVGEAARPTLTEAAARAEAEAGE